MHHPADTIHFHADRGDARLRLDQVLVRRLTEVSRLSRNLAQQWIELGAVSVDGVVAARPAARVREGAAIEVRLPDPAVRRVRPAAEARPLDILHEDDTMIVVNKPAGIVVHPSYKQASGTLLNALLWHLRGRDGVQPGILTRLDKDTSGLVVVALTAATHAAMQRDAAAGRIVKEYLALVEGSPSRARGAITLPLARDPADRRRMIATPGGAASETRYERLSPVAARSLLRCELVTGRTHQIRVHLAASGWPIVGDRLYGSTDPAIGRQALHAWRITLPQPGTSVPLTVVAPLPADLATLLHADGQPLLPPD
jgi:23S rRNA pseudouridine1911/1915/1917 synthase